METDEIGTVENTRLFVRILKKIKNNPQLKAFTLYLMCSKRNPRPRLWVRRFLTPIFHKRGKGAIIRWNCRIDVFPWHEFIMGDFSIIETFCTINNGSGDVILGEKVRIGIGSVVIGPVKFGNRVGLGQHVFISGFNHTYEDGEKDSNDQGLTVKQTLIDEDTHIGANCVVVAGVHIGKRCQIGAGSIVTKDIPDYSVVVGNPARIIKRFNLETKIWEKV